MRSPFITAAFFSITFVLGACAGPSWDQVRSQDSPAGYRRFIADHPRSKHLSEARERLAALLLERDPSVEALERFRREHADSPSLPDLMKRVEASAFEAARGEATPNAYARFLAAFPDGAMRTRATGNQIYLTEGGFSGRPSELARFLAEHSDSDYAAEAGRKLASVDARAARAFARISLEVEVAPEIGDTSRLRNVFSERARAIYADVGRSLVDTPSDAVLRIRHSERAVAAREGGDLLARPGVMAETEVTLVSASSDEVIFRDQLSVRVQDGDRRGAGSVLFTAAAASYWERFYVPVASWPNSSALRSSSVLGGQIAGVGADVGRVIALGPDGGFRDIDLSDPESPRVIGAYARRAPAASFAGARAAGGRVVLFGEDGAEIVARQGNGYRRVALFDRGSVGAVSGVELDRGQVLMAGTRGLVRASLDGGPIERLIERPLRGIARAGDTLLLLDDQWIYAGPIQDPRATNFFTIAEVGRSLEPRVLRVGDAIAVVVGGRGVATFALAGARRMRPLARLRTPGIGQVSDAAVLGGSVFVLGERGLLVIEPRSGRIVDSIDVEGRSALGAAGGQIVAIGGDRLDVVDATPWMARGLPAAITP